MDDLVTGVTTAVQLTVDLPPDQVWDLVTDVTRIGEWSPEVAGGAWVHRAGLVPQAGDGFQGHNRFPNGLTATVDCLVTQADRPALFEWVVLDDANDPDRPGSIWRYDLRADGAGTAVNHTFTHGSGDSGLRSGVEDNPDLADDVIAERLATLHRNMTQTLRAMTGGTDR
ncbi:MAG TPA: SRPBCC family protein [Actinocrinis sp.]|nr:SRPBCC family protein [Actinocrinis sp.]